MGRRRRSGENPAKKARISQLRDPSKQTDQVSVPITDMDDNCVQYHSASSDDEGQASSPSPGEIRQSPSDSEQDSEPEMYIGELNNDESDVELTLEFYDPTTADILPIQNFLSKYQQSFSARKEKLSARGVAEAVCAQTRVGSTVRITDDDTPVGFISCLNTRDHLQLLSPIRAHLLGLCKGRKECAKFATILKKTSEGSARFERERLGLILCERVLNLPPLLIPKMLEALFSEIEWAVEDEKTEKERDSYRLGWYLYITEAYSALRNDDKEQRNENRLKKSEEEDRATKNSLCFIRVEDEAWYKFSSMHLTWDVQSDDGDREGMKRKRVAMLINGSKIGDVRGMVSELVGVKGDMQEPGKDVDGGEERQPN